MDNLQLAPVIIGKLLNIGGMIQRQGNRILLPFGLNLQQFSIFFEIGKAGKVRQKEMVNRLLLEKAHVSKVVKKLHRMGLIVITASDEDRRSAFLELSPEGNRMLSEIREIFSQWHEQWSDGLDDGQFASILENLSYLQGAFEDKFVGK